MSLLIELINSFVNSLNTREIAIMILVIVFLIPILLIKDVRKVLLDVVRIFFSIKIIIPFIGMVLYITLILYLLYHWGFLNTDYVKEVIFWFVIVAMPLFLAVNKVRENKNFFRTKAVDYIKLITIFGFVINFYTLNLVIELILQSGLFFLILLVTFSKTDKKYKSVEIFLNIIFLIIAVYLAIFFINSLFINPNEFININTVITYVIPAILTILLMPFIYLLALVMRYEMFYLLLKMRFKESKLHKYVFKEVFKRYNLDLYGLDDFLSEFHIYNIQNTEDVGKEILNAEKRLNHETEY
ncbi:hypothetical protein DSECCO2_591370 [anaerobic digester metagenome]